MLKRTSLLFRFASYRFPTIQRLLPETDLTKLKKVTLIHPDSIETVADITP